MCGTMTYTFRSGPWKPFDVECELVACLFSVGVCVMSLRGETSAVEAGETDVDTQWTVLRICESCRRSIEETQTWLSKH